MSSMQHTVGTDEVGRDGGDRRSAQREATRARLFEETVAELRQRGFAETEIAVITERVGVSRGAFYVHFAGKDAVLRELLIIEERRIAEAALGATGREAGLPEVFAAVVDAVLAAERRLGRRLVRDLCAAQFRPEFAQLLALDDHPLGLMLVEEIAGRSPAFDAMDLAMVFLTGLFGLLATDVGSTADRRRRLDLLIQLTAGGSNQQRATRRRRT
jgi:AcrR family transcriptional regulator